MNNILIAILVCSPLFALAAYFTAQLHKQWNGPGIVKIYRADGGIIESTNVDDVIAWADGIAGAMGTEHCDRVTLKEILIANAIINTINRMPEEERNNARS